MSLDWQRTVPTLACSCIIMLRHTKVRLDHDRLLSSPRATLTFEKQLGDYKIEQHMKNIVGVFLDQLKAKREVSSLRSLSKSAKQTANT